MAVLRTKIVWTDPNGEPVTLTDVKQINVRKSSDMGNNAGDFGLRNPITNLTLYMDNEGIRFNPEQDVLFYARYDDDGTGLPETYDNLIFSGRVVEFEGESTDTKTDIKVSTVDSSFIVLNRIYIGDEFGPVNETVKKVIGFANNNTPELSKQIVVADESDGGFLADEKSDGTEFPGVQYSSAGRPVYKVLQELAQPLYTGEAENVNYRFFVDRNNELHFFYPSDGVQHVIVEGSRETESAVYTHPITGEDISFDDTNIHKLIQTKLKLAVYDITNFIIYKAGEDLEGNQIMNFAFAPTSGVPITKDSFRSWEKITKKLKQDEESVGNLTKEYGDRYTVANSSGTTSWGVAYGSEEAYNNALVQRAENIAEAIADAEFRATADPRWRGSIEVQGQNIYEPGDALMFTSNRLGIQDIFMRIVDVQHSISKGGWFTNLTVQEEFKVVL